VEEGVLRDAAAVAARVLADVWPDGRAIIDVESHALDFRVSARHDGVTVVRTGEAMGAALRDVIDLGEAVESCALPRGAWRTPDGRVAVELSRQRFRRRPRPTHWAVAEVEDLCRRLNAITEVVVGVEERFCRVCGFDDRLESARYIGGSPQYIICPCCGSESGVDDVLPEWVRQARGAWFARGRTWREPNDRPADWDPDAALAALSAKWRNP